MGAPVQPRLCSVAVHPGRCRRGVIFGHKAPRMRGVWLPAAADRLALWLATRRLIPMRQWRVAALCAVCERILPRGQAVSWISDDMRVDARSREQFSGAGLQSPCSCLSALDAEWVLARASAEAPSASCPVAPRSPACAQVAAGDQPADPSRSLYAAKPQCMRQCGR